MKTGSQIAATTVPKLSPQLAIVTFGDLGGQLLPRSSIGLVQPEFLIAEGDEIPTETVVLLGTSPQENLPAPDLQSKYFAFPIDLGSGVQLPGNSTPVQWDQTAPTNQPEMPQALQQNANVSKRIAPIDAFAAEAKILKPSTGLPIQPLFSTSEASPKPITADHNFLSANNAPELVPARLLLEGEKMPIPVQPDVGYVVAANSALAAPVGNKLLHEPEPAFAPVEKPVEKNKSTLALQDTVKGHIDAAKPQSSLEKIQVQVGVPTDQKRWSEKAEIRTPTPETPVNDQQTSVAAPFGTDGEKGPKLDRTIPIAPTNEAIAFKKELAQEPRPNIAASIVVEPMKSDLASDKSQWEPIHQNQPVKQKLKNVQVSVPELADSKQKPNISPHLASNSKAVAPPAILPSVTPHLASPIVAAASIFQEISQPVLIKPLEKLDKEKVSELSPFMFHSIGPSATNETQVLRTLPQANAPRIIQVIIDGASTQSDRPIELMLNPEELGRVRLTMQSNEGSMAVMISVERPETLELLRRNINQLAAQLREIGYQNLSFDFAGEQGAFDGGADNQPTNKTQHSIEAAIPPENPSTGPIYISVQPQTGIDIRL
ncbi:MAG: flagellar hook-length control protein FliK [Paracoccaceae bacterium]